MSIEDLIKNKKMKLTSARREILDTLDKAHNPLCYDDIKTKLSMDKATFYRNIAKFEEEGLLNAFESNDKKRYFELKVNPHAHFVCIVCNKVECIKDLKIDLEGYEIHNVIVNGKCKECNL
jgi:Fur family transcriptional regulator, ferric uptake regulator